MCDVIESTQARDALLSNLADTRADEAVKTKARQDRIRVYDYGLS